LVSHQINVIPKILDPRMKVRGSFQKEICKLRN
jgi:hypothetical protein